MVNHDRHASDSPRATRANSRAQRANSRAPRAIVLLLACAAFLPLACGSGTASGPPATITPPSTTDSQMLFGTRMAQRGLWAEALFRYRQAEQLDPNNPRNLNNIAVAYEALGQFDNALAYYQRAVKAAPGNKELRQNYARFVEFYRAFRPVDQVAAPTDERIEGAP
ncbi:MAG: tetratricopeptide repeat protein [Acidobacteriota bacterium]